MEYKIVHFGSPQLLASEVQRLIGAGWRPQGGVAVAPIPQSQRDYSGHEMMYFQAMTREQKA